jgi:hypothetical protein
MNINISMVKQTLLVMTLNGTPSLKYEVLQSSLSYAEFHGLN